MSAAKVYDALLRLDDPAAALEGALSLKAPRRLRSVPAPRALVSLAPAPGSVRGIREDRVGVTVFQNLSAGWLSGRKVEAGARILVSKRSPEGGDLAVVRTREAIRVVATGESGAVPLPPGGRFIGTVEAVLHDPGYR